MIILDNTAPTGSLLGLGVGDIGTVLKVEYYGGEYGRGSITFAEDKDHWYAIEKVEPFPPKGGFNKEAIRKAGVEIINGEKPMYPHQNTSFKYDKLFESILEGVEKHRVMFPGNKYDSNIWLLPDVFYGLRKYLKLTSNARLSVVSTDSLFKFVYI